MDALILADGDVRDARRARRGLAGLADGRSASSSPPTAARATPRRSAWRSTSGSATATRSARPASTALAAAGVPIERSRPDKDESDTELAVRAALGRGADRHRHRRRPRRPADRSRAGQRRRCWRCRSSTAGRAVILDAARRGSGCCARPARRRRRPAPLTRRARRRPRLAAAARAATSRASRPTASPTRWPTSRCRRPDARPVERPRRAAARRSPSGAGCLLVVEIPCYALTMSMPDGRRPRSRGRPARRDRHRPPPGRPARPLDDPLLLPEGRHARLHRRGVRVPRRQRDHPRARRRRLGHQPAGRDQQARVPREVRPAVHAPRRRGPRGRRGVRLVGREAELRQDLHGAPRGRRSWSTRRAASRGSGRRSSRRATPPRCWPRSTSSRRPRRRRDAAGHESFARGGRRAKPRPEAYCRVDPRNGSRTRVTRPAAR